ncbi:unnamed protein product [Jaminaea pallidilutea]
MPDSPQLSKSPWKKPQAAWSSPSGPSTSSAPVAGPNSAAFPALSATPGPSRRDRNSPWRNAVGRQDTVNPYPPRMQEIAHRVMAGADEGENGALRLTRNHGVPATGVFGMQDLDELRGEGSVDEDADFHSGPVQMYGLSRITVRDLSQPGMKGKNKAKREDITPGLGAGAGPQIYTRHNQPWVQKRKRPKEAVLGSVMAAGDDNEDRIYDEDIVLIDLVTEGERARAAKADLQTIASDCQRVARLQAAERRSGAAEESDAEPFQPFLEKLLSDLHTQETIRKASWTIDGSLPPLLETLPEEARLDSIHAVTQALVRLASGDHRQDGHLEGMLRALLLCFDLGLERALDNEAFSAVLRSLASLGKHTQASHDLSSPLTQRLPLLVKELITILSLHLEQRRLLAASGALPQLVYRVADALRLLHACDALQASEPNIWYVHELGQGYHARLVESSEFLDLETDAFLLPLAAKIRLLGAEVTEIRQTSRREALWSSRRSALGRQDGKMPAHTTLDEHGLTLVVSRANILQDTLHALRDDDSLQLPWTWRVGLRVGFTEEEGVDSLLGGLLREWFRLLTHHIVAVAQVLDDRSDDGTQVATGVCVPSRGAAEDYSELFGLLIGLSLFYQIPLGIHLSNVTLRSIMAVQPQNASIERDLMHLAQTQPDLTKHLQELLAWQAPSDSAAKSVTFEDTFALNWTATIASTSAKDDGQRLETIPLVSGGAHRAVTLENRRDFGAALLRFHLLDSVATQLHAMQRGFERVWPQVSRSNGFFGDWMSIREVAELVKGDGMDELPVPALQASIEVVNRRNNQEGRAEDDRLLKLWWQVVTALAQLDESSKTSTTPDTRLCFTRRLLSFVTSSPHLPLSFFFRSTSPASPPFRIHLVDVDYLPASSSSTSLHGLPLPWSSTCTATLFLPRAFARGGPDRDHEAKAVLHDKLLRAIELGEEGFGLK